MVNTVRFTIATTGQGDVRDITKEITTAVESSEFRDGLATVTVVGSTAAVTTI